MAAYEGLLSSDPLACLRLASRGVAPGTKLLGALSTVTMNGHADAYDFGRSQLDVENHIRFQVERYSFVVGRPHLRVEAYVISGQFARHAAPFAQLTRGVWCQERTIADRYTG